MIVFAVEANFTSQSFIHPPLALRDHKLLPRLEYERLGLICDHQCEVLRADEILLSVTTKPSIVLPFGIHAFPASNKDTDWCLCLSKVNSADLDGFATCVGSVRYDCINDRRIVRERVSPYKCLLRIEGGTRRQRTLDTTARGRTTLQQFLTQLLFDPALLC